MGFALLLGLLAIVAAAVYRFRLRRYRCARTDLHVDDEMIRRIEHEGAIEIDEPIDLDHVREEEQRFWEEVWDDPEEW